MVVGRHQLVEVISPRRPHVDTRVTKLGSVMGASQGIGNRVRELSLDHLCRNVQSLGDQRLELLSTASACGASGTRCGLPSLLAALVPFMRSGGSVMTSSSKLISIHSSCRNSPGLKRRSADSASAARVTGLPRHSSMSRNKAPASFGSTIAA